MSVGSLRSGGTRCLGTAERTLGCGTRSTTLPVSQKVVVDDSLDLAVRLITTYFPKTQVGECLV
jgi:hypothetical protein